MQIRLMFAYEHELLRTCIIKLFQADPDILVVSEGRCDTALLHKLRTLYVDVLLLGMSMPTIYEAELIAQIRSVHRDLPVLVLGTHNNTLNVLRVMKAGASGFITTHCAPHVLLGAIRKVATTGQYLDPELAEKLVFPMTSTLPYKMESLLSNRELQILPLIVEGMRIKSIAHQLAISHKTVSQHKANILTKLGLNNVADLVRYVMENEHPDLIPDREPMLSR